MKKRIALALIMLMIISASFISGVYYTLKRCEVYWTHDDSMYYINIDGWVHEYTRD